MLIFGFISDNFGRKLSLFLSNLSTVIGLLLLNFSFSEKSALVFHIFCGFGNFGVSFLQIVLISEQSSTYF